MNAQPASAYRRLKGTPPTGSDRGNEYRHYLRQRALLPLTAISECLRRLNFYNRSTAEEKRRILNLAIYLEKDRMTVKAGKIA